MKTISIALQQATFRLRAKLLGHLYEYSKPLMQFIRRKRIPWHLSRKDLAQYHTHTLGNSLYNFLITNDSELMSRFEKHDVYHVLLGYSPTVLDEIRMSFCLVGNGKRSLYTTSVVLLGGAIFPEYLSDFRSHFQKGKKMRAFYHWNFQHLLREDKAMLVRMIMGDFPVLRHISTQQF